LLFFSRHPHVATSQWHPIWEKNPVETTVDPLQKERNPSFDSLIVKK